MPTDLGRQRLIITDISGNTSPTDGINSDGGEVAIHTRDLRTAPILGFAMPYYSDQLTPARPAPPPVDLDGVAFRLFRVVIWRLRLLRHEATVAASTDGLSG
jgi:hypothetical protein